MDEFDSRAAVYQSTPAQLAKIMDLDAGSPAPWKEEDLSSILRHQLSAPLEFDLGSLSLGKSEDKTRDKTLSDAAISKLRTFDDLFQHSRPPLALLKLGKDFFKAQAGPSAERKPEQEVAYLMYLLAIVVARVRLQARITKLDDSDLAAGIAWAAGRSWVDDNIASLLAAGRESLVASRQNEGP